MLNVKGEYQFEANRDRIWPLIFDPSILVLLIPGCRSLEEVEQGYYRGQIQIGIAGIGGIYDTSVRVIETNPPKNCRFSGEVRGKSGLITGEAEVDLYNLDCKCKIIYRASGIITGALSKINSRYLDSIAQSFINLGLAKLVRRINSNGEYPADDCLDIKRDRSEV